MNTPHTHRIFAALASLTLAASSAQAASTIYNETFSDGTVGTPTNLNGTMDDTMSGTWTASSVWAENGSTAITTSGGTGSDASAFLAFTPTSGNVYTLSATMTAPTGGTGWVALGFAANNATESSFWANGTAPWITLSPRHERG